jgi:ADP-ribosylglycohydrolase
VDVLRNAIEAGGDTDTIASMAGQVAGAWLGASQIPRKVIESLPNKPDIGRIAAEFAKTVTSVAQNGTISSPKRLI